MLRSNIRKPKGFSRPRHNDDGAIAEAIKSLEGIPGKFHEHILHESTSHEEIIKSQTEAVALAVAEFVREFPCQEICPRKVSQIALLPVWNVCRALVRLDLPFDRSCLVSDPGKNSGRSRIQKEKIYRSLLKAR